LPVPPHPRQADGGNTTAANRLLGAIGWLAQQKPRIYDGLEVPLRQELPPAVEAQRWSSA
jgi:2,4-diaminopentanoate dehydrogenase